MAYKMKGHELPGPNQRKATPSKFMGAELGGLDSILGTNMMGVKDKSTTDMRTDALEGNIDRGSETEQNINNMVSSTREIGRQSMRGREGSVDGPKQTDNKVAAKVEEKAEKKAEEIVEKQAKEA